MVKKRGRVFVLEDNQDICEVYYEALKQYGYDVDIYNCYDCAVEAIEEKGTKYWGAYLIDLKVLKSHKEDASQNFKSDIFYGFELVRNYIPRERTLFVSGYFSPEIMKEIINLGVINILLKPVDLGKLILNINAIFDYIYSKLED